MPTNEAKNRWDKENATVFSVKLMRRTEQDLIEFFQRQAEKGIARGTVVKLALREYMENHKEES